MKKQNGITLIALVITIIVLLILAGVSIAMISGDDGIATRAQEAKEETEEQAFLDEVKVYLNEYIIEKNMSDEEIYPEDVVDGLEFEDGSTESDGRIYEVYSFKGKFVKVYYDDDGNMADLVYLGTSY